MSIGELRAGRLARPWFSRGAVAVARGLIGCLLVHELPGGARPRVSRIVETEAYCGASDLACHARAGLTKRTRTLLGEAGHAYVFFIYGMHDCFNVTCGGGHAVLVRAGEPTAGLESLELVGGAERPAGALAQVARLDGPGRFARAMGITRSLDGHDLVEPPLYLCPRANARRPRIAVTARVGVAYAGPWADRPWRFLDADSPLVSKPPKRSIGGGAPNRP
jgi:DNA-3-methyladenine glycosylase